MPVGSQPIRVRDISAIVKKFSDKCATVTCCGRELFPGKVPSVSQIMEANAKILGPLKVFFDAQIYTKPAQPDSKILNESALAQLETCLKQLCRTKNALGDDVFEMPDRKGALGFLVDELAELLVTRTHTDPAVIAKTLARFRFSARHEAPYKPYTNYFGGFEKLDHFIYRGEERGPDEVFKQGCDGRVFDTKPGDSWAMLAFRLAFSPIAWFNYWAAGSSPVLSAHSHQCYSVALAKHFHSAAEFPMRPHRSVSSSIVPATETVTDTSWVYEFDPTSLNILDLHKIWHMTYPGQDPPRNPSAVVELMSALRHVPREAIRAAYQVERTHARIVEEWEGGLIQIDVLQQIKILEVCENSFYTGSNHLPQQLVLRQGESHTVRALGFQRGVQGGLVAQVRDATDRAYFNACRALLPEPNMRLLPASYPVASLAQIGRPTL